MNQILPLEYLHLLSWMKLITVHCLLLTAH
jgi:hypothetical protein